MEDEETEVKVIHVDETTGTATDMEAIATEEKDVVIETEHFSVYVYVHLTKIYGTINVTVEHWGKNLKVIDGEANVEKGTDTVFVANKDNPYVKTKTVKARIYSKDTIEIPNEYYEDVAQLSKICNTNVKQKNYTVSEIWVCKSSQINNNKGRENDATWVSGSYTVYKPGDNKRIDLSADSLIRFWYTPVTGDNKLATDATFYDYDITDGKKYNDAGTETSGGKYVKTQGQGINSSFVSSTTENRLTIGQYASGNRTACAGTPNANNEVTGGGKLYGLYLNRGNGKFANGNSKVVQGIVKDDLTSPNGNLKYNVTVPKNLFKSATNEGSTKYTRYQLRFKQSGDTYTLDNVYNKNTKKIAKGGGGPNGKGLSTFGNFSGALSNNFWPMDDIGERNGHDPFMGVKANEWYFLKNNNKLGTWGSQSASDDNSDHNWHFGMTYTINFTVGDYTGPMEYYFRGDDDFWLFIDGTKVVDIGGIHSAVGHSVDLREWMKKKGMLADKTKEHTLKVFYMERGGFGSCCYMQFTIPNSEPVPVSTPDTETYTVRKEWADSDNWFRPGSIKVELQQKLNGTVTGTSEEIILSAANGWEYTWEDLPKKPGNTTQNYNYVYEAKEIDLPDGYYSKIVNGVLTNTLDPVKIKVQKNWINDEGLESSYRPDSVTMQLYYKTKETDQEQPYQDRTGKTRTITLNASNNWTAEFTNLPEYFYTEVFDENGELERHDASKVIYSVKEMSNGKPVEVGGIIAGKQGATYRVTYSDSVTIPEGQTEASFTVTNTLLTAFKIEKKGMVAGKPRTEGLQGAEFTLSGYTPDENGGGQESGILYDGCSGENGVILWTKRNASPGTESATAGVSPGTYLLKETKAPDGYAISAEEWIITVNEYGRPTSVVKKDNTGEGTNVSADVNSTNGTVTFTYTFYDDIFYQLPSTGGLGIYWSTLCGVLLMAGASLIVYRNKRKEVL